VIAHAPICFYHSNDGVWVLRISSRNVNLDSDEPRKRRRVEDSFEVSSVTELEWNQFGADVTAFEAQHVLAKTKLAFSFVEGPLVRALRAGHWLVFLFKIVLLYRDRFLARVLLDEINLASSETLEAITPLLHSSTSSLTLAEQGSLEPVPRHTSFRLFASMNPATDVGKKDLPPVLRSNFTEVWVPPPDTVREALLAIIQQYIGHVALSDRSSILDVAEYYEAVRKLAESRQISDGSNHRPHFSMRTLTRALTFASDVAPTFGLRRALWEGCLMSFTMMLETSSAEAIRPIAERHLLSGVKNKRALLSQTPALPPGATTRDGYVQVGPFFLRQGPLPLETMDEYILTPSVQSKLIDLSRIILTRRFPVLIEGPTSAGKTSSIEYLARRTGHRFVRVNNHEHTDIQEYIGTYISDPTTGKLVFQDGILVRALRRGDWIVLDELNLAPTDVLEALNRLLDDNRELLIPETQEMITPHPNFMLFATQNPPGLYAGRKVLSRAFRNRFLEVHFDDVPQAELETILCQRCRIAPSYAQRIVAVFRELQKRRQAGRVFESKHGFATLRDLFRWAGRDAVGYQQLADNGYMLLAERARRPDDKKAVKEAIESVMKVMVDPTTLYLKDVEGGPAQRLGLPIGQPSDLVWTSAFQRLFVLVASAIKHHEPVLLVGDTGTGKTSVCQYLAEVLGRRLYILNCHQNTETADLLGGLRPVRNRAATQSEACLAAASLLRQNGVDLDGIEVGDVHAHLALVDRILHNKSLPADQTSSLRDARRTLQHSGSLFEWHDGPLVKAMQDGDLFLLDEISLADDSVLERLNSVLEPSRTLVLAEKGGYDVDQVLVHAQPGFELVSTMNPGGDYGKKELSPALRNRFTEIWVPQVDDREDRKAIIDSLWQHPSLRSLTDPLLDFAHWMGLETGDDNVVGLRDITVSFHLPSTSSKVFTFISSGVGHIFQPLGGEIRRRTFHYNNLCRCHL
jgi:midasin